MGKRWAAVTLALALLLTTLPRLPVLAQASDPTAYDGYIIKLRPDAAIPFAAAGDTESLGLGMYRVGDPGVFPDGAVEFVEPNYLCELFAWDLVDDECYAAQYQWNLDFIDVGPLWGLTDSQDRPITGQGVTVAVLDTGLSPHEDLPSERCLEGYNAVDNSTDTTDIQYHGSFVAGVIAAQANNGKGIAGVAPGVDVLPCLVARKNAGLILVETAHVISAIRWATDHGADVINLSLGSPAASEGVQAAVDYAVGQGVIVVAAVGNDAKSTLNYPAACQGVIGVGAMGSVVDMSKKNYQLADPNLVAQYSNFNESVDVTAPGTAIYGPYVSSSKPEMTNLYAAQSGTSFAAPCVSALAALCKQYDPHITAPEFQNLLMLTADDRGAPGWDEYYGYGSVNAASMAAALPMRSITYELNGGGWPAEVPGDGESPDDGEVAEPIVVPTGFRVYQAQSVALPVPVREGYTFGGWYQSGDFTTPAVTLLSLPALKGDQTYYAQWLREDPPEEPSDEPTPTESPSPTVTPTESPSPTVTPTESPSPSVAPTESPSPTVTPTESPSPTVTPTESPSPTVTPTESPSPSVAPTESPSPSVTPTESPSPTVTPIESPSPSVTPIESPPPSVPPTEKPSPSPAPAESPSPSPSAGPSSSPSSSSGSRPAYRPSSSGSSAVSGQPPPAAASLTPSGLASSGKESFLLDLERGHTLTDAQRQSIAAANTTTDVTISVGSALQVSIPARSLAPGADPAQRLADASRARSGDVVFRVDAQGNRHAVPLSLVSLGRAAYVAGADGRYEIGSNDVDFDDVATHWARDAIAFSSSRELTQGMSQGIFAPDESASRAMALTLLARLEDTPLPASSGGQPWYQSAVNWAVSRGLSDGQRPQDPIRRQELVTLLWRWSGQPEAETLTGFTDLWDISPYARTSMAWAVETGIIQGRPDASLDPQTPVTRAETAVILQRFITHLVEEQTS